MRSNLVLIGMPGAGKSTLGVLLAKATARDFVDTDVVLQARAGRTLQDILDRDGAAAFRRSEEGALLSLRCRRTVIATGGSAVYSDAAMRHVRTNGVTIYLELPLAALQRRLDNLPTRGVVGLDRGGLAALLAERDPLYRRHADLVVPTDGLGHEAAVERIVAALSDRGLAGTPDAP